MTDTPKKLSATARTVLTFAATRPDHLVRPPQLPAAARQQVARSLLKAGLAEEVDAPIEDAAYAWRTSEDGAPRMLRATALGLARIDEGDAAVEAPATGEVVATMPAVDDVTGQAPDGQSPALAGTPAPEAMAPPVTEIARDITRGIQDAQLPNARQGNGNTCETGQPSDAAQTALTASTQVSRQLTLRQTAQALLAAWDDPANRDHNILIGSLDDRFAAFRIALAARAPIATANSRDTKQRQVLAMLRREEGASGPAIAEAMGWAPHTVRGFLAGLARKGINVEVLERVRQVGPNTAGAKGSYTIYRVAG